jgi:hypothetical protein
MSTSMRMQMTATRWEANPAVSRALAANAGLAIDLGIAFGASHLPCGRVKHTTQVKVPARRPSESTP